MIAFSGLLKKMAEIEFEEEQYTRTNSSKLGATARGGLFRLVQKLGLAKDERGAMQVLIFILFISLAITVIIWLPELRSSPQPATPLGAPIIHKI